MTGEFIENGYCTDVTHGRPANYFIVSLYKRPLNFPVNITMVFASYSVQLCRLLDAINTVFHSS